MNIRKIVVSKVDRMEITKTSFLMDEKEGMIEALNRLKKQGGATARKVKGCYMAEIVPII